MFSNYETTEITLFYQNKSKCLFGVFSCTIRCSGKMTKHMEKVPPCSN